MPETLKYFFLLGGYDLEMAELRKLLESQGLTEGRDFADLQLSWGAKLSAYANVLADPKLAERRFVGIELIEDIALPADYLRIDHHNELSDRPAAIVQVAALLGVTLDRWQLLVATNDARYIPGMLEMGATTEEIAAVRLADRKAQGVTEEDERLAEESVAAQVQTGLVTVVHSKTGKFSTVADRLYGVKRLLVYTDEELTYFGEEKEQLVNRFAEWIAHGKAYHGGGTNGFFGIGKGACSLGELNAKRDEIISLTYGGAL